MKTSSTKCLTEQIGFMTAAHEKAFKKLLEIGDVISETSRQFDSNCGAMAFAYMAVRGDEQHNDLIHEAFKHMLRESQKLVDAMNEKIRAIEEK